MSKFVGIIGYGSQREDPNNPGVYTYSVTERTISGELLRNYKSSSESDSGTIENINISNDINITSDPYARDHFHEMLYVKFVYPNIGGVWKISSAEIMEMHKIKLTTGGVYNGKQS